MTKKWSSTVRNPELTKRQASKKVRAEHRVMTWKEYGAWARSGDALDDHTSSGSMRGGLTILFGEQEEN